MYRWCAMTEPSTTTGLDGRVMDVRTVEGTDRVEGFLPGISGSCCCCRVTMESLLLPALLAPLLAASSSPSESELSESTLRCCRLVSKALWLV